MRPKRLYQQIFFLTLCFIVQENTFAQGNLLWSTYYGGTNSETSTYVTTDASNNVYMAGATGSDTGIASNGLQNSYAGGNSDAFLVKFDSTGNRLWATYYGGVYDDYSAGVATDNIGNVYFAGSTQSTTGIASGGFQTVYGGGDWDAFLVKLDATGNRLWATYYGGIGYDYGNSIAIDAFGNVYLAGYTSSSSGIAFNGFQNVSSGGSFLVKFNSEGTRLWATYYEGNSFTGIAIVPLSGEVYLSGETTSKFTKIAFGGFQNIYGGGDWDAFLVKFDSTGNRLWATYYGGPLFDKGYAVAADASGNVYLAGQTSSTIAIAYNGFQNTFGGIGDAFLVKFNSTGTRLWATYYGGSEGDYAKGIAVNASGNVYLSGDTYSNYNNIAYGGFQNNANGALENAFVAQFDSSGKLLCATYFGNTNEEDGRIALDSYSNVYLTGYTESPSGLAYRGFQSSRAGTINNMDAYLAKFTACGFYANATVGNINCNLTCIGTATVTPAGNKGDVFSYFWNTTPVQTTPIAVGLCPGTYTATITDITDGNTASTPVTITQYTLQTVTANAAKTTIFFGGNTQLSVTSGPTYQWSPSISLSCTNCQSPTATPAITTTYYVTVADSNGCIGSDSVTVVVDLTCGEPFVPSVFSPNDDGNNDVVCVKIRCVKDMNFNIYDRWGNNVFESINITNGWDGTYKGKGMDPAVFVYHLTGILTNGELINKKGNITLLR